MGREGLFQPVANSFAVQSLRHTGPFIPFDPWNWRDQGRERVKSLENSRTTSHEGARKKRTSRQLFSVHPTWSQVSPGSPVGPAELQTRKGAPRKLWLMAASQQGWGPHPEKWDGHNCLWIWEPYGRFRKWGYPNSWMVYTGKSQ